MSSVAALHIVLSVSTPLPRSVTFARFHCPAPAESSGVLVVALSCVSAIVRLKTNVGDDATTPLSTPAVTTVTNTTVTFRMALTLLLLLMLVLLLATVMIDTIFVSVVIAPLDAEIWIELPALLSGRVPAPNDVVAVGASRTSARSANDRWV